MAKNSVKKIESTELALPVKAYTREGFEFYPTNNRWKLIDQSRTYNLNFRDLKVCCDPKIINSAKNVLINYFSSYSMSHGYNIFQRLNHFISFIYIANAKTISHITSANIIDYKGNLPKHQAWYLGTLSGFFKKWYELGYPGIDQEVPALFNQLRIRGNQKGNAVLTMDPHEGPFSEIELHGLVDAINNAYATGEINTKDFILAWLFIATGARNRQIASLKIKDLKVQRTKEKTSSYFIDIPRAKQRGKLIRSEFKTRPLISEVGKVLEAWCEQVKEEYLALIADGIDHQELPIFPSWNTTNPPGFEHHNRGKSLGFELTRIFDSLNVTSERTGLPIKVTSSRFRYTLGTRAAMEGHGLLLIAELLDHSDTQNVGIYVEATPEIIDRIDKALALQLAPLAQAFSGLIVFDESDAERGDDPTSRIWDPRTSYVGTCGKYGFCAASVPIACYTCLCFQAWLDAPHEALLMELIAERDRILEATGDERIAFANDRTILAVAEVVRQCTEIKHQMRDE